MEVRVYPNSGPSTQRLGIVDAITEGAVPLRLSSLELRSKRVIRPVYRAIDHEMAAPQHEFIMCSGSIRQREPPKFTGTDDHDAEDWLSSYERVSAHNRWDDPTKRLNVGFYMDKLAETWFRNNEATLPTWSDFKERFIAVFGRPAVRKLRAEQRLRGRAQLANETYTSYIEDVVDLCRRVNPDMAEPEKVKHVLKGIEDDAFQMLLSKDPQSIGDVVKLCLSFDELRKQRLSTRQRSSSDDEPHRPSLSALAISSDLAPLLPHIEQFVREEVARQLNLQTLASAPVSRLPATVRRVIEDRVAEALPSDRQPTSSAPHLTPPVTANLDSPMAVPATAPVNTPIFSPMAAPVPSAMAAPLAPPVAGPYTYAAVCAQPPPATFQPFQYTTSQRVLSYPRAAPQATNPWRTSDNRPICFACGVPGHVARLCRRRPPPTSDVFRVPAFERQQQSTFVSSGSTPTAYSSDGSPYSGRRSISPRRRSISPMRPRVNSAAEGN